MFRKSHCLLTCKFVFISVESYKSEDVQVEVRKVIDGLLDYVERKEFLENMEIPHDDEAVLPEGGSRGTECGKQCCSKGCICKSLQTRMHTTHCKKADCIFECVCQNRRFYSLRKLPHREVKERKSKKKYNEKLPPKTNPSKRKRLRSKDRTTEDVPLVDLSMDDNPVTAMEEETIVISDEEAEIIGSVILEANLASLRMSDRMKLEKLSYERTRLLLMTEVFIWCTFHRRYNCKCAATVYDMRTAVLLRRPTMELLTSNVLRHQIFDTEQHSARTYGSIFDYRLRNSSRLFGIKRSVEMKNGVLANTNSFFKMNVSQMVLDRFPEPPSVSIANVEPVEDKCIPDEGLLCRNHSFGYLPIKELTEKKLVFQSPIYKNIFVCTTNTEEANQWLDNFFKSHLIFESMETKLDWEIADRGVLRMEKPFDRTLFYDKSKIINCQGVPVAMKDIFVFNDEEFISP